jgi:CheY-like chemotaxis protein
VAITVSDTGPGIEAEAIPRIFEPFFTTKKEEPPGLGLTQVYAFAERSGGMVTVASHEGQGASFTIYLPRATQKAILEDRPDLAFVVLPKKVLVVDDIPSSLAVAQVSLEDEGIEVVTASSGPAALEVLKDRQGIDVMLTDIRMPGMSGFELAENVRRLHPQVGVVLMTGYSEPLEQGLNVNLPVLAKPFTPEQLRSGLIRAVEPAIRGQALG